MTEHHLPNILAYTQAIESHLDSWSPLKRRTFSLLAWLWKQSVHLYPADVERIALLPAGSFYRILEAPDAATLGDVRSLLRALRVDLDWLAAGTDPLRYVDRWGCKHPYDLERRQSADDIGRAVEAKALALDAWVKANPPPGACGKPFPPKLSVLETLSDTLRWLALRKVGETHEDAPGCVESVEKVKGPRVRGGKRL